MQEIESITINYDCPPALIISYDRLRQAINANFSKPYGRDFRPHEQEAMDQISTQFEQVAQQFIYRSVNQQTLIELKIACQQIIQVANYQTGANFQLSAEF